ncbi:MAG: hemerythrin, partial [Betaproteobacteria bacterium]|nr:hemerythrin [Betaproteobacteria bacterium]
MNTPLLEWSDALALDQNTMDDTHREFVDLLNRVAAAPESELLASLDEFVKHTEEHF